MGRRLQQPTDGGNPLMMLPTAQPIDDAEWQRFKVTSIFLHFHFSLFSLFSGYFGFTTLNLIIG
ncbi:hypothetical protein KSS87_011052, partial [Heliosperma pusillum]